MSARDRYNALPADAPRAEYFGALRAAIAESYLEPGASAYRQSGRSSGAARWRETRHGFVDALHKDGDFMDVGCANGLLLETLGEWAADRGIRLGPHGIDFVPELVEMAQARHPGHEASFAVANAFEWSPARQYDYVRTNLEYVPPADHVEFTRRQFAAVAPGGRLILCHYRNPDEPPVDPGEVAARAGLRVGGRADGPRPRFVWVDAD